MPAQADQSAVVDAWFHPKHQILFAPKRYKVLYGGRAGLKCLGLGTLVLMYNGQLKAVEDIKVGDLVMGPDSTPREVLETARGTSELFEVRQTCGMNYVVNEAHILSLKKSANCKLDRGELMPSGNWRRPNGRYPEWPDIVNIGIRDYLEQSKKWRSRFRGYKAGLIHFPDAVEQQLIDPYFLGLWLGDGTSRELNITNMDQEVIEACREVADRYGLGLTLSRKPGQQAYTIYLPKPSSQKANALWQHFVRLGLQNDKHIPHQYLTGTEQDRLELLAGLIDTDGTMKSNGYMVSSSLPELAFQIKRLADGLGFRTNIHKYKTIAKPTYQISIGGSVWRIPCKIARKKVRREDQHDIDFLSSDLSVRSIGVGEYAGFELDGDHLFCLADGTVTHNSWSVARALVLMGAQRKLRILCAREFQKSIKESVHELLEGQIRRMQLERFYEIQRDTIKGREGTTAAGTEFIFIGLHLNTSNVKSYEDVDICWVEEAATVTRASWNDLIPTIRKPDGGPFGQGAEIWLSFNPALESDETYQRFIVNPPTDSVQVKTTFKDNPFLSAGLKQEIEDDKRRNFDQYLHVWEGFCKQTLEGAVYADELRDVTQQNRATRVPYDRTIPVNTYWDLGRSDHTSIWFVQQAGFEFHVIDFYENRLKHIDHYLEVLQSRRYVYDTMWLPHDGKAKQLGTKLTIQEQVQAKFPGRSVRIVPRVSIKDKINAARTVFPNCYFDAEKCATGLQHLRHYTYEVDEQTKQFSAVPLHDEHSDAASAFEYFGLASKMPSGRRSGDKVRETLGRLLQRPLGGDDFPNSNPDGWMR